MFRHCMGYVCAYLFISPHVHTCVYMCISVHMCMHVYTHTHTHKYKFIFASWQVLVLKVALKRNSLNCATNKIMIQNLYQKTELNSI